MYSAFFMKPALPGNSQKNNDHNLFTLEQHGKTQ